MQPSPLTEPATLAGLDVGFSVSDSADLARLGLSARHLDQAVGELARAVLIAGGRLTYGGRVKPLGFTQVLLAELDRYAEPRPSLTLCLAYPEHLRLSFTELDDLDRRIGVRGEIVCLDRDGDVITDPWSGRSEPGSKDVGPDQLVGSYSALRRHLATCTHARVLVGGKLAGFQGAMPGLIEEAIRSIEADQPLYLAGGYGGAAAFLIRELGVDDLAWAPDDLAAAEPDDPRIVSARQALAQARDAHPRVPDGLADLERRQLAATHRAGDIASLVVSGLTRLHRSPRPTEEAP